MKFIKNAIIALIVSLMTPVFVLAVPCETGTFSYTSSSSQTDFTITNTSSCAGWEISAIDVLYIPHDTSITSSSYSGLVDIWDGINFTWDNPPIYTFFPTSGIGISQSASGMFYLYWDTSLSGSYDIVDVVLWFAPPSSVPEPASVLLLASGVLAIGFYGRYRFKKLV